MSLQNKVIWSEGLFLKPHHLQQQDRYVERYVETRCESLIPYGWGFAEIELEQDFLSIGKLGVRRAAGVFPDGTPFRLPDDGAPPTPLEIGPDVRDTPVHLALPLRRAEMVDVDRTTQVDSLARLGVSEVKAADVTSESGEGAQLEVGELRTRLLLATDVTEAYACVPVAHIVECRSDQHLVLDDGFIPTVLHVKTASRLAAFMTELLGLFRHRGDTLGSRVVATGRGGAAEVADFLMLQLINRYEPLLAHFAETGLLHPEAFYRVCVSVAGELATFTATSKRPPALSPYQHHCLRASFDPVIEALRDALSAVMEQNAVPIPLELKKYGIRVARVPDPTLYDSAVFVLAAQADLPAEELRRKLPAQLRMGPAEEIANLVRLALPGVTVSPLPAAPRQLPFHAGSVYFELDQSGETWDKLKTSGGLAMHLAGEFPALELEFWAIRR